MLTSFQMIDHGNAVPVGNELAALARQIAEAAPGAAQAAEARLYRALAPRVRLYGIKHLRDGQLAEDLVQETMVIAIEGLRSGKVREPERIASFVLGTSRALAIDLRRGEHRRKGLLGRHAASFSTVTEAREPLDLERLAQCLALLVERDRAVVTMTFYAERSAGEIGEELTLTPANVRVVRHRALARLRDCMESGSGESPS